MQKLDYVKCGGSEQDTTNKKNGILAQKMPRRACRILSRSICHLYLTTHTHVSLPPTVEARCCSSKWRPRWRWQRRFDTTTHSHTYYHAWVLHSASNIHTKQTNKQNILVLDIYQVIKKGRKWWCHLVAIIEHTSLAVESHIQ